MEQQQQLLKAIFLSLIVILVYTYFFPQAKPNNPVNTSPSKEVVEKKGGDVTAFNAGNITVTNVPAAEIKTTKISTPLYNVEISSKGAVVKQFELKNYKETILKNSGAKNLIDKSLNQGTYDVSFKNNSVRGIENANFTPSNPANELNVEGKKEILTYSWTSPDGVVIEKAYEFTPDTYQIKYSISVKNGSAISLNDDLAVNLQNKITEKSRVSHVGLSLFMKNEKIDVRDNKIEKSNYFQGNIDWIMIQDRYFMISLIPDENANSEVFLDYKKENSVVSAKLYKNIVNLAPGMQKVFNYEIYAGPMSKVPLMKVGHNIDKAVNFGMFDIIAKPCLWLMNYIHDHVIRNYGVAIIMLTLLIKIALWPLGTISYRSMNEMRKLQPLMTEIREKYKDDSRKMNEEVMGLYKTYKVNPMSGCLPMVAQMPIFFAFYRMLYSSIELRHAPFFGWITDLSAPDRLFHFNFTVPFLDPPVGIPVLTLLMGASMFLQQKMSPPAGDPAQAKMMMFMPVFMTVIFMNFSSGLVLYWLVNNIVSITQQYYTMKK